MVLKVAVQMDPIQRINVKGDSTFALLLEAQKRGHTLSHYTPDRLAQLNGQLFAGVWASSYSAYTTPLDLHITRIRSTIEQLPSARVLLGTVGGLGYRFAA